MKTGIEITPNMVIGYMEWFNRQDYPGVDYSSMSAMAFGYLAAEVSVLFRHGPRGSSLRKDILRWLPNLGTV